MTGSLHDGVVLSEGKAEVEESPPRDTLRHGKTGKTIIKQTKLLTRILRWAYILRNGTGCRMMKGDFSNEIVRDHLLL